jgi:hypothetical protein
VPPQLEARPAVAPAPRLLEHRASGVLGEAVGLRLTGVRWVAGPEPRLGVERVAASEVAGLCGSTTEPPEPTWEIGAAWLVCGWVRPSTIVAAATMSTMAATVAVVRRSIRSRRQTWLRAPSTRGNSVAGAGGGIELESMNGIALATPSASRQR